MSDHDFDVCSPLNLDSILGKNLDFAAQSPTDFAACSPPVIFFKKRTTCSKIMIRQP